MQILTIFALALRPLRQRPIRTLLLLQGTIWGVAVAVFPSAVVEGTRHAALTRGTLLGADRLSVAADPTAFDERLLTREDARHLAMDLETAGIQLHGIGGIRVLSFQGRGGRDGAVVEADPGVLGARGLRIAAGRPLRTDDPPDVCVLEAGAGAAYAGAPVQPGGEIQLEVGEGRLETFRVVGVLEPLPPTRRTTNDLGFDVTHPLYDSVGRAFLAAMGLPFVDDAWKRSDALVYVPPRGAEVDWILLRADPETVGEAARVASVGLAARDRQGVVLHPLVLPYLLGDEIDRFMAVRAALFLACLVMGAVVMANLGLLTVLRRTREIAIRRVEGATRTGIGLQFLAEGLLLSIVGCVVGCVLGMGLAQLRVAVEPVTGFAWIFPWKDGLLACGVAIVIGVSVSLFPAWRASRMQPARGLAEEST